jgi:hypothetical protein
MDKHSSLFLFTISNKIKNATLAPGCLCAGIEEELWGTVPQGDHLWRHRLKGEPKVSGQAKIGNLDASLNHQKLRLG